MNVTIRQLRVFVTIARLGSFIQASKVLHVTQPALSSILRDLEGLVGFRLLDRTTRRVKLSEQGQQYFQFAERVLTELGHAERCAVDLRNQKAGIVRIATTQVIVWSLLPKPLAIFSQRHPDVRLTPIDVPVDLIISSVETGHADIAISMDGPVDPHISAEPMFKSRVNMICQKEHPLARRKSVTWRELADQPLVLIGPDAAGRFEKYLDPELELNFAYEVGTTPTALALAASGLGIVLCAGYVRPLARVDNLRVIPMKEPDITRQFSLYTNLNRSNSPAVDMFRTFLLEYFDGASF